MDYSTTSYAANGGDGGGGWVKGSQNDNSNKRDYANDNLRPVTVKQLMDAHAPSGGSEYLMVDGKETTHVTFVGQVRNRSFQHLNHVYKLDDGTGVVEVKLWVDPESENSPDDPLQQLKEKLVEGSYARVFGSLKEFNNKRHVHCRIMRPVSDLNEIQYHLLEATYVHLVTTRGLPGDQGKSNTNGVSNGTSYGGSGNDKAVPAGTSTSAKKVFTCLKNSAQQDIGLHVQMIASQLNMEMSDVMKATDELSGHGLIYSTEDEHTFAVLDV